MTTQRSEPEVEALKQEAERRVRAGETRIEVALSLGVSETTLAGWAVRGGWRRKDIARENREENTRRAAARIAEVRAIREEEEKRRQAWRKHLADGGKDPRVTAEAASPERLSMQLAASHLEQGEVEEAERAARLADRLVQAQDRLDGREQRLKENAPPPEPPADWQPFGFDDPHAEKRLEMDRKLGGLLNRLNSKEDARWQEIVARGTCPQCGGPLKPDAINYWEEVGKEVEVVEVFEFRPLKPPLPLRGEGAPETPPESPPEN